MFRISATVALLFIGCRIVSAFDCCIDATSEDDCEAVSSGCLWIANDPVALGLSSGVECVTASWFKCTVDKICPPPPPVPPVPSDCILDPCENTDDTFNVGFIVDESGSVGKTNYKMTLEYFVKKMIVENLNEDSLISFISFSDKNDRNWLFSDTGGDNNNNRDGVLEAIEAEKDNFRGSSTCLGDAVEEIITDYTQDLLTIPAAQRGKQNVLLILTDGLATCMEDCATYRQQLIENNIITYIVGITNYFKQASVQCLVQDQILPSDPRYDSSKTLVTDYIITAEKFDPKFFYQIQMQLRRTVCPPIVFEEETFVNKLYVVLSSTNDMINENLLYVISMVLLIIGGLVYGLRERLCSKNDKYEPLRDASYGSCQSV